MNMRKEEVYLIMSFNEKDYREIITKAVIGKGRKFTKENHSISPSHRPSSILGCWVINHLYNAKKKSEDTVEVRSEEHTSELQSRGHLVCRLLLEKKNKIEY